MIFVVWRPGMSITPPAYVDANLLVGAAVSQHRLYRSCSTLIGDLLASQTKILLSDLAFSEAQMAIARISYGDLTNQRSVRHFSRELYNRWCGRIFQTYGPRFQTTSNLVKRLVLTGFPIEVVPGSIQQWVRVMDLSYTYMQQNLLMPADSIHLGLAETHAHTFITGDADFARRMTSLSSNSGLMVLTVAT